MVRGPIEDLGTVLIQLHDDDTMTVTVDGAPLPAPHGRWVRDRFATAVDLATEGRAHPARIEVREADGTVFTDLLPAARTPRPVPADPSEAVHVSDLPGPDLAGPAVRRPVQGAGFLPGEEVAITIVTRAVRADSHGVVQTSLPAGSGAETPGEVLLVGRTSGTLHVLTSPS